MTNEKICYHIGTINLKKRFFIRICKSKVLFPVITVFVFYCRKQPAQTDSEDKEFTVTFDIENSGGGITAKIKNGKNITSPAQAKKGKTIIFTADTNEDYEVKSWTELTPKPHNSSTVNNGIDIKVKFILKDFIAVIPSVEGVIGKEVSYELPIAEDCRKGIFVKDRITKLSPYNICKYELTYKLKKKIRDMNFRQESPVTKVQATTEVK